MNKEFERAFRQLNEEQLEAVKAIEGPTLVIAGPGTGKTQLISARVGHILRQTDTPPGAILLLTFTEAGVQAMRERLNLLIGEPAYDIQINTYHAFGGDIFRRYSDYFETSQLSLVEELEADSILRQIIAKLPYSDPLKFADTYIGDIKNFISDSKKALLSPNDIIKISTDNLNLIDRANKSAEKLLSKISLISRKTVPLFENVRVLLSSTTAHKLPDKVLPILNYLRADLETALDDYYTTSKTTMLSEWKRKWLEKDSQGRFIFSGKRQNQRLNSAAQIYKNYQDVLIDQQLYDYDDMILRAIDALQDNPELKYSLAERFSHIMLDEFQDTNPAQFKLVQLLTDHPVNEGRPNILAVGDDDQAIYAFQGAEQANLANFVRHYKDVRLISLKKNYRSSQEVIEVGQNIRGKITTGIEKEFNAVHKDPVAADKNLSADTQISMREFRTDTSQYSWVASQIKALIDGGMDAREIAILAPKHRYLEPFIPYLARFDIKLNYERRENILNEPVVHQLVQMSRLVVSLADSNQAVADHIWPEVLSYPFWRLSTDKIWRIAWQAKDSREPWTGILLNDEKTQPIASFFLELASLLPLASLEQQLDQLLGVPSEASESENQTETKYRSPIYNYYFSGVSKSRKSYDFIRLVSNLSVIRARLRDWRRSNSEVIGLRSLVEFVEGHRAAGINIINTSPYFDNPNAVNILTSYGAKGREFQTVFLVSSNDEVWGNASRNQGYRLSLPANLSFIRYQGASEDERLRLLYVAATRAKTNLFITSYNHELSGKPMTKLRYFDIAQTDTGKLVSDILPPKFNEIIEDNSEKASIEEVANYWTIRHQPPLSARLADVLKPKLGNYQLNPTDLIKFLDVINGGPERFFVEGLLGFPRGPSSSAAFGTAIHNTLRSAGVILQREGSLPTIGRLKDIFKNQLASIDLTADEYTNLLLRGQDTLKTWLGQKGKDLRPNDRFEYSFRHEGSSVGGARLSGKIDRLVITDRSQKITLLDYKIGKSYDRWQSVIKLHQYRQQLMFYKLLLYGSRRFRRYSVNKGTIQFVEPDADGVIRELDLDYDEKEIAEFSRLMTSVWQHIQQLDFPDTSKYPASLAGIKQFEQDLIKKENTG